MKALISCREAVRRLWRFVDEELEGAELGDVEEHLEYCVLCCGELEFVRELRGLLGAQRAVDLPGDVQDRLERLIDELSDTTPGMPVRDDEGERDRNSTSEEGRP